MSNSSLHSTSLFCIKSAAIFYNCSNRMKIEYTARTLFGTSLLLLAFLGEVVAGELVTAANETDEGIDDFNEDISSTEDLFEGDLKLSKEIIAKFYNFSSLPGGEELLAEYAEKIDNENATKEGISRKVRAVGSETSINLWTANIVRYTIRSSIRSSIRTLILQAIRHWQDNTCLRFLPATPSTRDYIYFTDTDRGCYSDSIGRKGGRQIINLQRNNLAGVGCETFGIAVHEIAHALGFWHEHTRPDRDRYVRVNIHNVVSGKLHNFLKRKDFTIDYQGSNYDYGSILHYGSKAFSRRGCIGSQCITISVTNTSEYNRQGRPTLGQRTRLSAQDIVQANRLYSCRCLAGAGVPGNLTIFIREGINLLDTDPGSNLPDPYVTVTAVDCSGNKVIRRSQYVSNQLTPIWNQSLSIGVRRWQFFRISVWDYDFTFSRSDDDQLTRSQTVIVSSTRQINQKLCQNDNCTSYILFDHEVSRSTTVPVRPPRNARLQVKIRSATNLRDTDPGTNLPDPLVRVEARRSTGSTTSLSTRYLLNTLNPTWNQWLNFSCQPYTSFTIQIFDYDFPSLQALSQKETITPIRGRYVRNQIHNGFGLGRLIYDYQLLEDGNECLINPCRNGGRCIDGCASYTCVCPRGYTGTNCQISRTCTLSVRARYGVSLLNRDSGSYRLSDPYMQFTARYTIGSRSYTLSRSSNYKLNTLRPNWNQQINFGSRLWTQFQVRVYDEDFRFSDDALSPRRSYSVYRGIRRTGLRHYGYSGYVVFDYSCL